MTPYEFNIMAALYRFEKFVERADVNAVISAVGLVVVIFLLAGARVQ